IHDPVPTVGSWEEGSVSHRVPEQAPCGICEPSNGIPGCCRWRPDPKLEPAIPGQVLQFHRTYKEGGIEPGMRVVCQVFYPGGELRVDVFLPQCIPYHNPLTTPL